MLSSPAKNVFKCMSHRSHVSVVDRSDVVYFGVWMNFIPSPRTDLASGGVILLSVRSLMATTSTPGFSRRTLRANRPILPNPLMATFMMVFELLF